MTETNGQQVAGCPFCHHETAPAWCELYRFGGGNPTGTPIHHVECIEDDGGCGASTGLYSTQEAAIAAWNQAAQRKPGSLADEKTLLAAIEEGDRLLKDIASAVSVDSSLAAQSTLSLWLYSHPRPLPLLLLGARASLELPEIRARLTQQEQQELGPDGVNYSGCGGSASYVETDEEVALRGQSRSADHNYNIRDGRIYTLGYGEGAALETERLRATIEEAERLLTVADQLADDLLGPPSIGGGEASTDEIQAFRKQVAAFRARGER